jgi:hypothetical protein
MSAASSDVVANELGVELEAEERGQRSLEALERGQRPLDAPPAPGLSMGEDDRRGSGQFPPRAASLGSGGMLADNGFDADGLSIVHGWYAGRCVVA